VSGFFGFELGQSLCVYRIETIVTLSNATMQIIDIPCSLSVGLPVGLSVGFITSALSTQWSASLLSGCGRVLCVVLCCVCVHLIVLRKARRTQSYTEQCGGLKRLQSATGSSFLPPNRSKLGLHGGEGENHRDTDRREGEPEGEDISFSACRLHIFFSFYFLLYLAFDIGSSVWCTHLIPPRSKRSTRRSCRRRSKSRRRQQQNIKRLGGGVARLSEWKE